MLRKETQSAERGELAVTDLGNEAEIGAEVVAEIIDRNAGVVLLLDAVPVRMKRVRLRALAIPHRRQIGTIRVLRAAVEELAGDRVGFRRPPLKVGTDDAVVSAVFDLAIGHRKADERAAADVMTQAANHVDRFEILRRKTRPERTGNDC